MRIVIKVGTSTLAYPTGHVNLRRISRLCRVLSDFKNAGHEVILVSSGAIGMGVGKLGLGGRPEDIQGKQAAAAVGQCELMYTYDKEFAEYHHTVAQILITGGSVNVRSAPGVGNPILGVLKKGCGAAYRGEKKNVDGRDWYRVEHGGRDGWVSSRYAEVRVA